MRSMAHAGSVTGTHGTGSGRPGSPAGRLGRRRPDSGIGGTQHPQVPAAPDLGLVRGTRPVAAGSARPLRRARRLAYGVRQGFEIVTAGPGRRRAVREPDDLPAAWRGQSLAVFGAQVIAMGLGIRGERAEDRGRIGIDVRQCRDSGTAARGARTATYRAHDVGRYRTLERAATTRPRVTRPCRDPAFTPPAVSVTALTCTGREAISQSPSVIRSPLGANQAGDGERHDPADLAKRAQAWPECSICDMPSGGLGRPSPHPPGELRCVSDGQSRTAAADRAETAPP